MLFVAMAAASLWLFFLIFFGDNGVVELLRKRDHLTQLSSANEQLVKDNLQLYRRVDRLHNDPAYIEAVARRELGMVRPDELIFTFAPERESPRP